MDPFTEYRSELTALTGAEDPIVDALARFGPGPWRRTYGRFHPHEQTYCTLLYEAVDRPPVRVRLARERERWATDVLAGLGAISLTRATDDEELGTLAAVLAAHPGAVIMRYRPGKRCTVRARHPRLGEQYIKVFRVERAAPRLHAGMEALWMVRDELAFAVAEPLGFDASLRAAAQGAIAGTPAAPILFGPDGLGVAAQMGRAAASLPHSRVASLCPLEGDDQVARTSRYAAAIGRFVPDQVDRVAAIATTLCDAYRALAGRSRKLPIHGGLHPTQWVRTDSGLGLVDFDRLSIGDPELDVATFVAELRYERRTAVPAGDLCRTFVDGYAEHLGLDERLIELYVAHKEVAKLVRLIRAPRPDAPARFSAALDRLEESCASW